MGLHLVVAAPDGLLKVKVPILFMQRKKNTRELILSHTYKLLFTHNWEAITIEQIENSIGRTRGSIFYSFKNKSELFNAIISERFFCKFALSEIGDTAIIDSTIKGFFSQYHTPFERVVLDMVGHYGQKDPNLAILNILVQARKLYPNFNALLESYVNSEIQYITDNAMVMKKYPKLINPFKIYIQLTCGALLFQSRFCAFDTEKQLQSYVNSLSVLLGE